MSDKEILAEARSLGLAFVEDDFTEDDIYNPLVDRPNAESWLLSIINRVRNENI
jgi:hypothetical protein